MTAIGGYNSPVNLAIGQVPLTTDPELFTEMTGVYNAIHLLNQYLDKLRLSAGGGGTGQTPAETLPFFRFFVAIALEDITAGMPVAPSAKAGENGVIPGCLSSNYGSATPYNHFCGIALTGGLAGTQIRVGVGPAVLEVPGAVAGTYVWAYSSLATNGLHFNDGGLYINNPGGKTIAGNTSYPAPVATVLTNGFALFSQFILR